jgi:23S rRNA (guanosine2251-2'-O)-methyltransferase
LLFARDLSQAEREIALPLAEQLSVPYKLETSEAMTKLCKSQEHQGYLAKMPPFPYDDLNSFEQHWPQNPLLLVLDGIQDPYNFGAILRSAEVLGADAVLIGMQNQAGVTSQVARSSAGAVNHMPIIRVSDLPRVLSPWRERGVKICGASEKSTRRIDQTDFTGPIAVIIGNEGTGIRGELLAMCDHHVAIPDPSL